ncbi:glycosyltransferase family 32 protein [Butyrivibrio sp. MC2013]|uniref:glycosyltransferase family 32 protein n=1 Tax=Butyrivibrio sp. MC2013 TaxID=1280686 RepID=UPI00040539DA|nr:glycosyltransferase [Butyrivibrio sp. MC2013]
MSIVQNSIPKIIHYCWFGGKPIPDHLQSCLDSWSKLKGYEIKRWDESNCSFDENDFVRTAYAEHRLGFIGDYYRLKAVYEYGGIYLDTDVMVNKSFDDLLKHNCFLNFIYECSVGTAIIGSRKGNPFIKGLMDMYDKTLISHNESGKPIEWKEDGMLHTNGFAPTSNYYFTYYILNHYPKFILNNKFQDMGDFVIYPKEMFEIGRLDGKHYAIHLCDGVWRNNKSTTRSFKDFVKAFLISFPWVYDKVRIAVRSIRYKKKNKYIPFYAYSQAQLHGLELPKL